MTPGVTAITPTRDRPDALSLCLTWMMRQDYKGDVQWLVVDDGDRPVSGITEWAMKLLPHNWHVSYVRRLPSEAVCTLQDNLISAIPHIAHDKILIVEDDEWYSRDYISKMAAMLDAADIVGEKNAHYYNVYSRRWWTPDNQKHASLCRTGLRWSAMPLLAKAAGDSKAAGDVFVDMRLWQMAQAPFPVVDRLGEITAMLQPWTGLSVGIKGMPGRGGLGRSHQWDAFPNVDPNLDVLVKWIGNDAYRYAPFSMATNVPKTVLR